MSSTKGVNRRTAATASSFAETSVERSEIREQPISGRRVAPKKSGAGKPRPQQAEKSFKMIEIRSRIPALQAVSWRESNRLFLATFAGILAAVYVFILLVDPYGVVPFSPPFERPIMSSQRQMYPQILRTGRYDSIVVGTS